MEPNNDLVIDFYRLMSFSLDNSTTENANEEIQKENSDIPYFDPNSIIKQFTILEESPFTTTSGNLIINNNYAQLV